MNPRRIAWVLAGILLTSPSPGPAQQLAPDSARLAAARSLLDANGTVNAMIAVLKANLPAQRAAMPQVPAEFWTRFEARVIQEAPRLLDSLTVVYARSFSLEDLMAITAFYKSAVGQRLRDRQPTLVAEGSAIGQRWGARIGAEVEASLHQ